MATELCSTEVSYSLLIVDFPCEQRDWTFSYTFPSGRTPLLFLWNTAPSRKESTERLFPSRKRCQEVSSGHKISF